MNAYMQEKKMIKKIATIMVIIVGLIIGLAILFLYEDDTVDVKVSEGSADQSLYLVEMVNEGNVVQSYSLDSTHGLETNLAVIGEGAALGEDGVFVKSVAAAGLNNLASMAIIEGSDFHNGVIEIEMNGSVSENASLLNRMFARGFIGVCFRMNDDLSEYECLYLRPTNGPSDNETRKNHAVQYTSHPDWDFARTRKETPGKYEAAAPIAPEEWQTVRIEVEGEVAKLYINDGVDPVLVVNDMKLGQDARGAIGLWVGQGTNGFFRNLTITKFD